MRLSRQQSDKSVHTQLVNGRREWQAHLFHSKGLARDGWYSDAKFLVNLP